MFLKHYYKDTIYTTLNLWCMYLKVFDVPAEYCTNTFGKFVTKRNGKLAI